MEEEIKLEAVLKFLRTNNFSKTESALREEIDFVRNQTYSTDDDEADLPKLPPVRLQASDGHSENDIDGNSIANSIESARFLSIANTPEGFFDLDVDSFPYCASGDTYLCGKPWPLRPVSRGRSEDLSDRLSGFLTAGEGDCLSLSDSGNENPCHNSDSSTQEDNNDLGFRRQLVEDRPRFLAKEISGVEIDEQVKFENICDVNEDSKGSHAQKQAVSDEETWELSSVVYVNNLETRSTFCKVITCGTEDYEAKRICYESPCKLKSQKSCYTSNDQMHSRAADEQVESSEDDYVHGTSQNCLAVSSTLYAGSEPGSKSCEVDHKDECDSRVQVHNSFKEDLSYQLSAAGFQTLTSNAPHSTERNNNGSSSTASSVKDKEILSMGPFERLDLASQTSNDCLYAKEASEDVLKENPNERCEIEDSANEPLEDMEDPEFLFQQQDNGGEEEHEEFTLKIIHRRNRTGFEEEKDFTVHVGSVIAGRYHVTEYLGSAAFSKAIQAHDLHTGIDVCMKIIKNNKDFFDQSLDEIKLLKYVNRHDPADKHHILRLYDYFYYREHLFIVCELLRANLYEFQMFNKDSGEEYYFNMPHLQSIARQVLESLDFLHGIGLIHCDLKPENILMKSYSRCEVKIIDLGSSCFQTDNLCSYVQSRSYRAPEVILGLPYDEKIDIWSVGCILGELCSGSVLFDNDSVATLLARIIGMLGPIGPEMLARGCETHKYFTNSHLLYERDEETDKLEYIIPKETSLAQHLPTTDAGFLEFVTYLLQINPMHRPNAKQALDHPWLSMEYEEI